MAAHVDNFYTTDPKGELALQHGYQFLGIACYVFNTQVKDTVPVYRCFNQTSNNHFYGIYRLEFDNLVKLEGYKPEHIAWFMFSARQNRSAALNRYYNQATGDHSYSTDDNISKVSDFSAYTVQGIAGYVLKDNKYSWDETRAVPLYWWYYKEPMA
jgi:hypothetical protein